MNEGISENMSMTVRNFLASIALLCGLGLFACSWPWPSAEVDSRGLGQSDIAKLLENQCCTNAEDRIARDIVLALEKARVGRSPRASAESIGFTCEDLPSRACKYAGEKRYRFYNLPKGHEESDKIHIVKYVIFLPDYDDHKNVRVMQTDTVVQ